MPGKRITLKQLIDSGLLQTGEELTCEPYRGSGEVYQASLNSDGFIDYQGQPFGNPSAWAKHLCGGERNGWDYVYAREEPLKHFRQQFQDGTEPPHETRPVVVKPEPVQDAPQNDAHSDDEERLKSEMDSLKSRVAIQQSEIAILNTKIDNLSVSPLEEDSEDDIIRLLLERVLRLSPDEFEQLVGEYLKSKGFSNVVVTRRSRDDGIDGHCENLFINVKVAFQAKRYAVGNTVGIEPVQRLKGSLGNSYDRGLFITTSEFTSSARGWMEEEQVDDIVLVEGGELMKDMVDLGLGVEVIPVIKHEVDEGFFADLEKK